VQRPNIPEMLFNQLAIHDNHWSASDPSPKRQTPAKYGRTTVTILSTKQEPNHENLAPHKHIPKLGAAAIARPAFVGKTCDFGLQQSGKDHV
jgi:hypothetical protein